MILFPDSSLFQSEQRLLGSSVTVTVRSTKMTAPCPSCGETATRIHSRYHRRLADLPVSGSPVSLVLVVRRFLCLNLSCTRQTFAERFPTLTLPHAQRTTRLRTALQQLGMALGGEAGARLGTHVGLQTSPTSLLRLIRQAQIPQPEHSARIIGIDDWASKRRLRYGTLICDLETGKPLDLLPDRSMQTVCSWLEQHPTIEVISRDRSGEYAAAAQKGAPQAQQVADRWHLLNNLSEHVSTLLAHHRSRNKQSKRTATQKASAASMRREQDARSIHQLHQQGVSPEHIALRIGVSLSTVYRYLARGEAPSGRHRDPRASVIDPYQAYVRKRWQEGCRTGAQICRELRDRGYRGSERAVYRFLTSLRDQPASASRDANLFSVKQATWLFLREPTNLDEQEQRTLTAIRESKEELERAYQLIQAFRAMVRERQGDRLDAWLASVAESRLAELQTFALGIERDKAAVQAGLTLPYSNGLLEGHTNRLKLIKRSMYGRAKFDLLRQRVLCAS
jgi:transposase